MKHRKPVIQKLRDKMGAVETTLPCMEDSYVYPITQKVVDEIRRLDEVSESVKDWFYNVNGDIFDAEIFFECMEKDTGEVLTYEVRQKIISHLEIKTDTITIKRLSMLQLMEGKHYPAKLTQLVQKMYESGSTKDMLAASNEDEGGLLSFNQWVACQASVDPKIYSLKQATKVMNGVSIDPHWFAPKDFMAIKAVKVELDGQKEGQWTEAEIAELGQFDEIMWVEDFQSDADLTHIVNIAFNGPESGETPNVEPFPAKQ